MILALDVGNGSIKFARFARGRRVEGGRLALDGDWPALPEADRAAAVSVNPPVLARLREVLPGLLVVGQEIDLPLPVLYDPPTDCGPDRVMGVWGALQRRPDAAAVLVLDSGTCLTATLGVRGEGVLGGAIAPGVELMARALADGTQTLPLVDPLVEREAREKPERFVGRSTQASIRSGVRAAFLGAARELIARFREECPQEVDVVAAGSGAGALAEALQEIDAVHPFATLWGVYLACSV